MRLCVHLLNRLFPLRKWLPPKINPKFWLVGIAWMICGSGAETLQAQSSLPVQTLTGRATGILPWELAEISGLAHCRSTSELLWALNDRGHQANLYALSSEAKILHTYALLQDRNKDWEDLACGQCADRPGECLYIGDIGSNNKQRRKIQIYMIPLPIQTESTPEGESVKRTKFTLTYPEEGHNAEALLVHPQQPILIVITKERHDPEQVVDPQIYWIDLAGFKPLEKGGVLQGAGKLPLNRALRPEFPPGSHWITAGDFYPDGRQMLVMSYTHLFRIPWPLPDKENERILAPIWSHVDRSKLESLAIHPNGKQFWTASEVTRWREPLLLMELPTNP